MSLFEVALGRVKQGAIHAVGDRLEMDSETAAPLVTAGVLKPVAVAVSKTGSSKAAKAKTKAPEKAPEE